MFGRGTKAGSGNDELLAGEPSAFHDNITNIASVVIEDNVVDISELFIIDSVHVGSANVIDFFTGETVVAQCAVMLHTSSWGFIWARRDGCQLYRGSGARDCGKHQESRSILGKQ